jgi:nicotinamide riboside transporter PnuC
VISFISGLVSAFIFMLVFFGVKWTGHSLTDLALFFLAIAVAFVSVWPWAYGRNRNTTVAN